MSEIPFVDRLGDAIDAAVADPKLARRGGGRRARRVGVLALAAVLVIGGTVAAAELLTEPDRLAATEVDCLYDPGSGGGGVGIHPGGQDPVDACRAFLAGQGKSLQPAPDSLVACVRADAGKVVVIAGRQGDCERYELDPVPVAYTPEREKVARLERDLRALEGGAECIPLPELTRQVQRLLNRSGWAGWRATPRPDLSEGPCAHVLSLAEGGTRTLELDARGRQLLVVGESPRATADLLGQLSPALAEESVARCFTVDALTAHVRQRVEPTGRKVSFKVAAALPGSYSDPRASTAAARYAEGCAILQKLGPDPDGRDVIALIERKG